MKIGIDARLWSETGVGRYIRNLVWELEKLDKENQYVLFVKKGFKSEDSIRQAQDMLGFKNDRWRIVETDVHWHSVKEQLAFPQVLYKENLDLMHFTYFSLPVFYNRPFVVTIHDLIINHFPTGKASTLPSPLYHLKRIGYNFVIEYAVKNSQKIIVPLNAVKDDVMQTFNVSENRIAVTYEGSSSLRATRSNLNKKEIDSYFLYVGNAYPHKNLERLIEAFDLFTQTTKGEVKLVLVGKDDYFYKRIRAKIEQKKGENVVFKHNVSDEELFALYSHAKAFISPSLMEGFGLPPLEAMSASCPVLLSDIPSFNEVCQDAALYFDPTKTHSLQEQLQVMYTMDHKRREEYIRKGLERVKQFSWKRMAEQTLNIYESSISVRQSK